MKKEEVTRDYKQIAKENVFMANAKAIRDIGVEQNVDIGVALDMFIFNEKMPRTTEPMAKAKEFRDYCRETTLNHIVEELSK